MSDILFKAETRYEEEHAAHIEQKEAEKRNGQMSMFDLLDSNNESIPNDGFTTKIAQIKQSILEQSQGDSTRWEFDNLRCALIENGWFAQFSEKEFRTACKDLHEEGKIERISLGRGWSRGTEFIVRP